MVDRSRLLAYCPGIACVRTRRFDPAGTSQRDTATRADCCSPDAAGARRIRALVLRFPPDFGAKQNGRTQEVRSRNFRLDEHKFERLFMTFRDEPAASAYFGNKGY